MTISGSTRVAANSIALLFFMTIIFHCGGGGLVAKSCPTLATPWTAARQAPLSMGFSRQGYWGGFPFPSPGDLPDPGIEPRNAEPPELQADSLLTAKFPLLYKQEEW